MNIKKIKPLYTSIVTTMDQYTEVDMLAGSNIIDPSKLKKGVKEYQKVISVGDSVRAVKEGDIVCINPSNYAQKKFASNGLKDGIEGMQEVLRYNFNIVLIDGKEYLLLQERDVEFVVVEFDDRKN